MLGWLKQENIMLCNNDSCVNYRCEIRKKSQVLRYKLSWQGFKRDESGDYKTDSCGFKRDIESPINEIIKQKVNDE